MNSQPLRDAIRHYATERHYRLETLERWLGLGDDDARALYRLATSLRLGENQLRDLWQWAADIAVREQTTLAAVLEAPEITAALEAKWSRNDRLQRVKHILRRRRFPQLCQAEDRARSLIEAAALPASVDLALPRFFEGEEVVVTCRGKTPAELQAALQAALRWTSTQACAELFALLGGEA
ncbi:hypothetical protein HRbin30_01548 [bacterium HR30]|nr:hypothetical protein HRbin30_01548 [bacterium HR30]